MLHNKIISIILLLLTFICFCTFEIYRKADKAVVKIITPTTIQIENETICIPDVETFTSNLNIKQTELEQKMNITFDEGIKLGYVTDSFAESMLADKRVKLKYTGIQNQNCKFADIYINKISYKDSLLKSGLGLTEGKPNETYLKQLEKAKKLNLVILNHKSNKFHTLECKYGQIANDTVIITNNSLPKEAVPCKFCHIEKVKHVKSKNQTPYPLAISSGSVKMYLTDLTTVLKPHNKCSSPACKEMLAQINSAKNSIDIALYGWDNVPEIFNALSLAKARGVRIRIAYDISNNNYYPDTKELLKLANMSAGDTPKILMHNKFMIFDDSKVFTGSMNFSKTGLSGFNSNCTIFMNSVEIARIYKEEFEQMINGKFHASKIQVKHKAVQVGDIKITPLFSPKDKAITNNIIPLIDKAKHYIYIPAFIITHDELANALIRAKKRNVTVKIITDATNANASRSKINFLRTAGILVKVENYAGKMHSKSIIIDDKYTIAGSMNFSNSGENKNDENCLIIESERLARYYRGFFEYLWTKIPDKYLKINPQAEGKASIGSCSDGIDNDYDGKIDMQDEACR